MLSALKKRDLDKKTKNKIADDIVKKKGDTSKSDDRYAYEGTMYGYSGGGKVKKELGYLSKAVKTMKGKNVAKADKVEEERKLADRLHRKRKLYDRTVPKAMDYARREGEAAGHARYRMGQLYGEMDKVKDKMKKEK